MIQLSGFLAKFRLKINESNEMKLSEFGPVPDFATDTTERVNRLDDCTDFFLRK